MHLLLYMEARYEYKMNSFFSRAFQASGNAISPESCQEKFFNDLGAKHASATEKMLTDTEKR